MEFLRKYRKSHRPRFFGHKPDKEKIMIENGKIKAMALYDKNGLTCEIQLESENVFICCSGLFSQARALNPGDEVTICASAIMECSNIFNAISIIGGPVV